MSAAMALNQVQPSKPFGSVARGLLSRIHDVSKNLTNKAIELSQTENKLEKAALALTNSVKSVWNSSREDKAWMALTVAAGIGAKLGAFAALNIASGGTLTAALVGGAAVGVTKSLINAYRESKKDENISFAQSFFSKKTLMTSVSTTALSAASFGTLGAIENVTGVNIAEKIGQGLHHAFNAAAKFGKTAGQFAFNNFPSSSALAAEIKAPQIQPVSHAASAVAQPIPQRPAVLATQQPQRITTLRPAVATVESTAYKNEYAIERLRTLLKEVGEVPKDNANALELAQQFRPDMKNPDSLVRALESRAPKPVLAATTGSAITQAKLVTAKPEIVASSKSIIEQPITVKVGDTDVPVPNLPNLDEEFGHAQTARLQEVTGRVLRAELSDKGIEIPKGGVQQDMAVLLNAPDPSQAISGASTRASQVISGDPNQTYALKKENLALSCVTQFANSQEELAAQGGFLPTTCATHQPQVKKGMFASLRNIFSGKTTLVHYDGEPKPTSEFLRDIATEVIPQLSARQLSLAK